MKQLEQSSKLTFIISSLILVGCSTQSFNKKIENPDVDFLREESLMRYNSNRLEKMDLNEKSFISKALLACHQNKFTKGLDLLEGEMQNNKSNPFYWNALGTCYSLSKNFTKANFYYSLGIEALPMIKGQSKTIAEATISNNLGLIHLNFNRYNEAFEAFSHSSSLLPNFFTPQFNIAQLYIEFNENDKALQILKKLEDKTPDDIDLLYSLSLIYFRKNDTEKSFAAIQKIKPDYLNRPDIVGMYAYNLMKKNRLTEAKIIIEKRLYADEYNQRNKILLEEINHLLKEQSNMTKPN
jgi:tetratricopeptide (TPR) repeat protein